jgi:hypothetical protein
MPFNHEGSRATLVVPHKLDNSALADVSEECCCLRKLMTHDHLSLAVRATHFVRSSYCPGTRTPRRS